MWTSGVKNGAPVLRTVVGLRRSYATRKSQYDALVIGGGHNGLVAAAYLQRGGLRTAVLERRHVLGGAAVTEEIIPGQVAPVARLQTEGWTQKSSLNARSGETHLWPVGLTVVFAYRFPLLQVFLFVESVKTSHMFRFGAQGKHIRVCKRNCLMARDLMLVSMVQKHGLKVYRRNPHAFTPMLEEGLRGAPPRSLTLGSDLAINQREISKFSQKDAEVYADFVAHLEKLAAAVHPLLDAPPVDIPGITAGPLRHRLAAVKTCIPVVKCGLTLGTKVPDFYEILTAPIMKILNRWFTSEPLKATLATDGVIGAMTSPSNPGSGYVLLHHVMGELEKEKGAWGYVEGGMGGVSQAIASSARSYGADIFTEKDVEQVLVGSDCVAKGVVLKDGTEIHSRVVLSNATPYVTFRKLTPQSSLSPEFISAVDQIDYTSPVTKINVAVDRLPSFLAAPTPDGKPGPHHQCSIHLNCESVAVLETAYKEAINGRPSARPMIEMTVPSVLDPTLAPPGCHVISLFTQFTPYHIEGKEWTDQDRQAYADRVIDWVEQYAPGFKSSVIGRDILTPPDLEKIFGLSGGNIFHGSMSLDQLYLARPLPSLSDYRSPIKGLYLCGSGSHPGGGVMGSPGWNAALAVMADLKHQ